MYTTKNQGVALELWVRHDGARTGLSGQRRRWRSVGLLRKNGHEAGVMFGRLSAPNIEAGYARRVKKEEKISKHQIIER